ncbi:hypothetical protein MHTCC0001_32710 [Flavobacteriaceae bacterium MHTCC 0001]
MELKIFSCNNFYKLKGALNEANIETFRKEMNKALENYPKVSISINDVMLIDSYAVNCISDLYFYAKDNDKELTITGDGCKALYDHFETHKAA